MTWASADGPRSVLSSVAPAVLGTGVSSAAVFAAAAATVVAPVSSVATPPSVATQASGAGLLAADGAVATVLLRGTFAGIALEATLGIKTGIDVKKVKEDRRFLRAELTG